MDGCECPEFDIMLANKYGFRSTGHTCGSQDASGAYHNCDGRGSCSSDVHENDFDHDYMPGSANGIDTNQEFHVRIEYLTDSENEFIGYSVTLTQGTDRRIELVSTGCHYLRKMTNDIKRMAFAISNWDMNHLDWL